MNKRNIWAKNMLFALALIVAVSIGGVATPIFSSDVQAAEKTKTVKQVRRDAAKKLRAKANSLTLTVSGKSAKAKCKSGDGKHKCSCTGICVSGPLGCTCDSSVLGGKGPIDPREIRIIAPGEY